MRFLLLRVVYERFFSSLSFESRLIFGAILYVRSALLDFRLYLALRACGSCEVVGGASQAAELAVQ
jgi:hypothetical protein